MKTVIYLVRHASHDHLGRILTGRQDGAPLTPKGREEARALGRHLAGIGLDALYTSPRLRARETAAIIGRETAATSEVAEELDEIDFGSWSGRTFDDLALEPAWRQWNEERHTACTPAGETMGDVAARLLRLIERLHLDLRGRHIALVSHSDVIKAGLCHYFRVPFSHVHGLEIDPGSLTTLEIDDRGRRVLAWNKRPAPLDAGVAA